MKKPLIGVTPSTENNGKYHVSVPFFQSLERAGAIPVLLPMDPSDEDIREMAGSFDGFLFAGGCDVSPFEYGEETRQCCGEIQPARDRLEITLFREIMKQKKPCLAICRGIQVINVATGGTLYQDLTSEFNPENGTPKLQHSQNSPEYTPTQHVSVRPGTLLHRITGETLLKVNSHHHQAVKELGKGFVISATSPDGLIEAIERENDMFCLGVQWHPEHLSSNDPVQAKLFNAFVRACEK